MNTVDITTVRRWVGKSRDSGVNMDLSELKGSGRTVTATQDLNRKTSSNLFKKIDENQPQDLRKDPKEADRTNQSRSSGWGGGGGIRCVFDMITTRPHTGAASTSTAIESIGC
jgi:hypothetical protein